MKQSSNTSKLFDDHESHKEDCTSNALKQKSGQTTIGTRAYLVAIAALNLKPTDVQLQVTAK